MIGGGSVLDPIIDKSAGTPASGAATRTGASRSRDLDAFRLIMQLFAATTVAAGALIGLVPLGLEATDARLVATVLLMVGIGDSLVLLSWDRLVRSRH